MEGQSRFLNRVWRLVTEFANNSAPRTSNSELSKPEKALRRSIHIAIKEISEDLDGEYQFNTAISELMKLTNALTDASCKESPVYAEGINALLILLAPFAPHVAEELWYQLGHSDSIHLQSWLKPDPEALVADEVTIVIQILGKTRGTIATPAQIAGDKVALEQFARDSEVSPETHRRKGSQKSRRCPWKAGEFRDWVNNANDCKPKIRNLTES